MGSYVSLGPVGLVNSKGQGVTVHRPGVMVDVDDDYARKLVEAGSLAPVQGVLEVSGGPSEAEKALDAAAAEAEKQAVAAATAEAEKQARAKAKNKSENA